MADEDNSLLDKELTSTSSTVISQLLSSNEQEKNDLIDTIPTSSTDASTSSKTSNLVSDDPISSTSEMDPSKPKQTDAKFNDEVDKASTNFDTDAELLGISIISESTEKIEENVDDLVSDLETLLGESTTEAFSCPKKVEVAALKENTSDEKSVEDTWTNQDTSNPLNELNDFLEEPLSTTSQGSVDEQSFQTDKKCGIESEVAESSSKDVELTDKEPSIKISDASTEKNDAVDEKLVECSSNEAEKTSVEENLTTASTEVIQIVPTSTEGAEMTAASNTHEEVAIGDAPTGISLAKELSPDVKEDVSKTIEEQDVVAAHEVLPEENVVTDSSDLLKECEKSDEIEKVEVVGPPTIAHAESSVLTSEKSECEYSAKTQASESESTESQETNTVLPTAPEEPVIHETELEEKRHDDHESKQSIDKSEATVTVTTEKVVDLFQEETEDCENSDRMEDISSETEKTDICHETEGIAESSTTKDSDVLEEPEKVQGIMESETIQDSSDVEKIKTESLHEKESIPAVQVEPTCLVAADEKAVGSNNGDEQHFQEAEQILASDTEKIEHLPETDLSKIQRNVEVQILPEEPRNVETVCEESSELTEKSEEVATVTAVETEVNKIEKGGELEESFDKIGICEPIETSQTSIPVNKESSTMSTIESDIDKKVEKTDLSVTLEEVAPIATVVIVETPVNEAKEHTVESSKTPTRIIEEKELPVDDTALPVTKDGKLGLKPDLPESITSMNVEDADSDDSNMSSLVLTEDKQEEDSSEKVDNIEDAANCIEENMIGTSVGTIRNPDDGNDNKEQDAGTEINGKPIEEENNTDTVLSETKAEIVVRRKTVEQDLEKVVCLSEDSSDSDTTSPIASSSKPPDVHPFDGETNLIQITEVEQLPNDEIEVIPSVNPVDSASNLETMLAVASLQNENVPEIREERRLSEKEIREMEAIRMAVASITDSSSQDTYDSYLVDNSMSIENAVSEDAQDEVQLGEPVCENSDNAHMAGDLAPSDPIESIVTDNSENAVQETISVPEDSGSASVLEEESPMLVTANNTIPQRDNSSSQPIPTCEQTEEAKDPHIEESVSVSLEKPDVIPDQKSADIPPKEVSLPSHDSADTENVPISASDTEAVVSLESKKLVMSEASEGSDKEVEKSTSNTIPSDKKTNPVQVESDEKEKEPVEKVQETKVINNYAKIDSVVIEKQEETVTEDNSEGRPLRSRTRRGNKVNEPLSINVEEVEKKEKVYSPKITIKPVKVPDEEVSTTSDETNKGSLKMTITKQSDKMHSILKVYDPEDADQEAPVSQGEPIPKLIIKTKMEPLDQQQSPKMTTRSAKSYSPTSSRCSSPRVTIKPVTKPAESKAECLSPLKISFKAVKSDDSIKRLSPKSSKEVEQKNHNPKITIKPIPKPIDSEDAICSTPKLTIKPLKRPLEETVEDVEERSSPKIIIKPVVKPTDETEHQMNPSTPKLKIKPIKKTDDDDQTNMESDESSKVSTKLLKHDTEDDEEVKERIVLKINKGTLPQSPAKKREHPEEDKCEKVAIKLKFSTTGGQTHIVQEGEENIHKRIKKDGGYSGGARKDVEEISNKRVLEEKTPERNKRLRSNATPDTNTENNDGSRVDLKGNTHIGENKINNSLDKSTEIIADIASRTDHIEASSVLTVGVVTPTVISAPKKRGRPRKTPLEVREELKDPPNSILSLQATPSSTASLTTGSDSPLDMPTPTSGGRPKRSCRGQNIIATLGLKPRKPRGRGRGSKVNMGDREPVLAVVQEVPSVPVDVEPVHSVQVTPASTEKVATEEPKGKIVQEEDNVLETPVIEENTDLDEGNIKSDPSQATENKQIEVIVIERNEKSPSKKNDKPPTRKLGITTRRQKAQLEAPHENIPVINSPKTAESDVIVEKTTPKKRASISSENTSKIETEVPNEVVVISTDEESLGKDEVPTEVPQPKPTPPLKRPIEQIEQSPEQERSAKIELQIEDDKSDDLESDLNSTEDKDKQEEDVESVDSEEERRKEWVLQRKREAIVKCRAKRMEKLARAAEMKKKRQEQAEQQRLARRAAEETEKSLEKGRATKRYGRYGVPKPQISLIDAPVQENQGTIRSQLGLLSYETERIDSTQSMLVDDDCSFLTPSKSAQESMLVDSYSETPVKGKRSLGSEDIVMLDEDTRMSADFRCSGPPTPYKQFNPSSEMIVEDSQGSMGTEGGRSRSMKGPPKMEVFQDLEAICSAEQLAEYSWNGQGPYMLQEQVAQYLGIKSFKRKYPNITRRTVEMQERDYLKESGLATEAQCDLGLTVVNAQDILDIMYTDFQDKYEEFIRAQREKQAKDLANKQKAMSQFVYKPGFDKLDILEQTVQSAAAWNLQLNKARKDERKTYMDLQTFTVHYPKHKRPIIMKPKVGHFPVALVPGQFTDWYAEFTPTELNNLPLNTMCYDEIKVPNLETPSESGSESDSDSDSSASSSSSGASCNDKDCKDCVKHEKMEFNGIDNDSADDVVIVENDASSSDSCVLVSVTAPPPVTA